jgi:transcriptional regulator with XRE-family HTH domain
VIHRALKLIRQFHRVKQTDLADRLDISKSFLSEVESGKKAPTLDLLDRYAREFKMPASTFLLFAEHLNGKPFPKNRDKGADKVFQLLEWIAAGEDDDDVAA